MKSVESSASLAKVSLRHDECAARVFQIEAQSVAGLAARLTGDFSDAVECILQSRGRVIVCGMGKSGIIGKKIAATLASTGTPSFFMHPGEAYHGDLGMVTASDVFVGISYSGETDELVKLLPFLSENGNRLIAITGNSGSSLALAADYHLDAGVDLEACPLRLAPTSSTTAALAMGDALAVALMEARDFKPENFARFHPGGSLGRRLLQRVEHEMVRADLPFVARDAKVMEVMSAMTKGRMGIAIVNTVGGFGLITDGDVRRAIEAYKNAIFSKTAEELMTLNPVSVAVGTRVEDALMLMSQRGIGCLLVRDGSGIAGIFRK